MLVMDLKTHVASFISATYLTGVPVASEYFQTLGGPLPPFKKEGVGFLRFGKE